MKLIDAILNVDRTNGGHNVDAEAITESLNVSGLYYFPDGLDERFKSYPIFNWCCTDTHVGIDALYMDDKAVGYTFQSGRKMGKDVYWLSSALADEVRAIIMTYLEKPEYSLVNPDDEISEFMNVNYAGEALTDKGFYNGRPVKAIFWYNDRTTPVEYRREGHSYYVVAKYGDAHYGNVVVEDEMGTRFEIPVTEFKIKINVNMEKVDA